MNRKKVLNKLGKIFVVLTMILSMCFSAGNTTVSAWDGNVPHEFTKVKSITYPAWWKQKCPQITKQWSTYMCKYNGQWSYCLEASKNTPSEGNYTASVIENNVMVRKLLYYGFGGPAQCLFNGQALTDDGMNEEETGYLYTHVLLSLAYSGDMCGANIDDLENAGIGLKSDWQKVEALPDPSNGAGFSTGDTAKFTAIYDGTTGLQITNTVTFNANSNETVQIPLQNNVTIHIAGTTAQQTGGTATVYGGQSFYLTTPVSNRLSDYTSGVLNSSAKGKFCALAISDGNGSSQTHGSWAQETVDSLRYSVDWIDFGWIDITKKSSNANLTDGNRNYSLENAVYEIYRDGKLVETLTTDKNGHAKSDLLAVGSYMVKEKTASKGYKKNETQTSVTVKANQTASLNGTGCLKETPKLGTLKIKKKSSRPDLTNGNDRYSIAGAKYQLKDKEGNVVKTLTTDENGEATANNIPLGNYTLVEAGASKGYKINISQKNISYSDEQIITVNGTDNMVETPKVGTLKIQKVSKNPEITNNSSCYSLKGAVYELKNSSGKVVKTLTTDAEGKATATEIPLGEYTLTEKTPSKGYKLSKDKVDIDFNFEKTISLVGDGCLSETPENDPVGIEIVKNDKETVDPQGDAKLHGAEFTVKYYNGYYTKNNLPSKATRTWVLTTKKASTGQYVASLGDYWKVSGDAFYKQNGLTVLPLGTISIEETKAPEGYFLKGAKLNVTDTATGTTSSVVDAKYVAQITEDYQGAKLQFGNDANQMIVQEQVKKQRIRLFKSGEREGISGVVKGLQGAEFTWKLKSEVDNVGWDNAKTYSVITTNENGNAMTDYLPYGKYLVRETKTPKDYMTAPDFTISVTKDSSEYNELEQIKLVNVNNKPFASYVKLIKVDEETGKKVTLNSASFKIKDAQGNYVVQKVSGKKVDTFTTNSDNEIIPVVEKGTVTLPLMLNAGTYTIEEIKTPKGFLNLEKPVEFIITSTYDYDIDEDADPIVEVKIRNKQPKGEIKINKTVADLNTDVDLVDRTDLSKIQFVLKAKKDICSSIDGSLMFEKDSIITTENSGAIVNAGSEVGNGIYALSTDGHLDISNLPMSADEASYYLQEVRTLDGCVLDTNKYDVIFVQKDSTTKFYIKSFDINNETTHFEFNKTDVTGDKEVEGATLTIRDEEGNVVDQWVSTDKSHSIEGLVVGKTYTLSETITAEGYVKAADIQFTVKNSSELETVTMKDKQVSFAKTDVTGEKEVEGATITVKDKETGKVVDEWISGKDSHFINGLEEGRTYILSETVTPEEYVKATDIEFTVSKEKVNEKINMKDKQVKVSKLTVGGQEVTGALMKIIDEDGNVIDEWISEGKFHYANNLEEGKTYTLHENLASTGLNLANDFTFDVTTEKENQKVEMTDTMTEVDKTDIDGKAVKEATLSIVSTKTKQIVDQWVTGQHIIDLDKDVKAQLEENGKAEGTYMDDEDSMVTFSISKNKDRKDYTLMQVKDGDTTYANIDLKGNETTHRIQGLIAGENYILRETKTPEEYVTAKEIEFTADEKEDQELVMQDKQVIISKTTVGGDEVTGALMQIKDEDGNVVDEWTSDGKVHYATGLVEGKKYTLHEDLAPIGLNIANDIYFEVNYDKENQKVTMIDTINEVSKVDEKGNLLKGAEMTVTSNKTKNIIDKWTSGQHIFDITKDMKADLQKDGKSEGMYVDDEDSTVTYSLKANKDKKDYTLMLAKDGEVIYTNVDINGDETSHMIQGLEAGKEYVLKETKTPNGYATFKTQIFKANENKDASLSMNDEDTKVEVSKQDITTKKELEGAQLKVTDKDGKVIDEWTSGKQPHMIKNLTVGETYTLTEIVAPKKYNLSEEITFMVKDTGKTQKVIMYDQPVNEVVITGDENNWSLMVMMICIFCIYFLRSKSSNNFIY